MSNKVRIWFLMMCKNTNIKPTARGLKNYWKKYKIILDDKRINRINNVYSNVVINTWADFNKYPINTPY